LLRIFAMRKPVITQDEFEKQHMQLDETLRRYRVSKPGRGLFNIRMKKMLSVRHAGSLKAINAVSRIAFARALVQSATVELERDNVETVFFITVLSDEFAVQLDHAKQFKPADAKAWIKDILGDVDHVGIWEVAYYYRSPFLQNGHKPHVVWHAHLIAWNVSIEDVERIQDSTNKGVHAFLPGRNSFHYRKMSRKRAMGRVLYMSKGCISEYTAYPRSKEVVDPETGEIFKIPAATWVNRKRPIRPGSLAKVTLAVKSRSIRSLCFAGGNGKSVRHAALTAARLALARERLARDKLVKRALMNGRT
jgi:hypothetical protein